MGAGGAIALVIGFFTGAAVYAHLTMRLTSERDPAIPTIMSVLWPLLLPFLLVFWAAQLGQRD
jgi:hypothetical protein